MRVGIQLQQLIADGSLMRRQIEAADDLGLASVWVGDHIVLPAETRESTYPYSASGEVPWPPETPWLEALSTLSFAAAVSQRLELGVSVLVLPARDEMLVARQLGTIASFAPGRVILGVGAGWWREEFEALRRPFDSRAVVLDEQLEAIASLWRNAPSSYSGEHVEFAPVFMEPRPDPPPAIWVGGNTKPALRRAGRLGDAWHGAGIARSDDLAASMAVVRETAASHGRNPDAVALTARVGIHTGQRGVESFIRRLDVLAEAGCIHVVVDPGTIDIDDAILVTRSIADHLHRYA
jgi:probable F420-dependent oxidoreductase